MRITLAGSREFAAYAERIRAAGRGMQRDLAEGLRKPTRAAVEEIREKILHADMAGFPRARRREPFTHVIASKGVKRPIAHAVQGEVKVVGAEPRAVIGVRMAEVPLRIRPLVYYFTGQRKRGGYQRLRHPIMGNREAWVGQRVPDVWHIPNVEQYRRAVRDVLDTIANKVKGR